jgi:hypothetical protein
MPQYSQSIPLKPFRLFELSNQRPLARKTVEIFIEEESATQRPA